MDTIDPNDVEFLCDVLFDASDARGATKRKRTDEDRKSAHRDVERRRTKRINRAIEAIRTTIRCEKKDKVSVLEAALVVLRGL